MSVIRASGYWALWLLLVPALVLGEEGKVQIEGEDLQPRQPQMAVDDTGAVHVVFGSEGAVYYCSSSDSLKSLGTPVLVGALKHLSLGMRRGPRIAIADKTIVVTAIGGEIGGGRDGDLFAWSSSDRGTTWSKSAQINDASAAAREGLHALAAGPCGLLYCAWLDLRNDGTEIAGSSSSDGGRTWSKNQLVYRSPDESVCECCHPSVAFAADGTLFVMWRNAVGGNRDMYVTTSRDGGRSFDAPRRLGLANWELAACPMDGGAMAVDRNGLHAAWRRQKTVYLTETETAREIELGKGEQPWLALTERGAIAVWLSRRPGDLFIKLPGGAAPQIIATAARDPVVVALPIAAIVAWETQQRGRASIHIQRVTLGE